jgi:polysaccharide biosynthesis protein PslE
MFDSPVSKIVRRQAFVFTIVVAFGIALTVMSIVFAPRKYGSRAKLLLKLGRENVAVDPTVTTAGDLVSIHRTYEGEINSTINTMASREILEMVVDEVGVDAILRGSEEKSSKKSGLLSQVKSTVKGWIEELDPIEDRERAIITLQENLVIKAAKESSVVDVTYTTKTPQMAQRVAQAWVNLYRAHHADINATKGSLEFFVELESELANSLDENRYNLQAAKSRFGIVTIGGEQETLESQVRWARGVLTETTALLKAAQARVRSLEEQRQSTKSTIVVGKDKANSNEAQDRMREQLYQLEIEHQRIVANYNETHPKRVASAQQLQEAKNLFNQQTAQTEKVVEGVNSVYEAIEQEIVLETANVDSMTAKIMATKEELARLLEQSTLLNQQENEVAKLQRSVDILEAQYRIRVQNREQARLATELEARNISNVNVFQSASLEQRPVSPNKKLCAILGLIGTLMSAFGIVAWREARRAGLLDPEVKQSSVLVSANSIPVTSSNELGDEQSRANGQRSGNTGTIPSFTPASDIASESLRSVPR